MRDRFLIGFVYCFFTVSFAQEGKVTNHIYEGNEEAQNEAYIKAEKSYRKALSLAPEKAVALYNLGNTHFLDKKYDEASQRFFQTQKFANSKEDKHRAFHNMGNVYMQKKEYQKAVEAYKNALRNNPADEETRYNYALAKELLENEKPPEEQEQDDKKDQDQQDKDQEDEQEKDQDQEGDQENKDEQDQDQKGDEGDESDKEGEPKNEGDQKKDEKPNEEKNKPEEKKQPPKQGQLSPQQVQSLLEAMNNQEKKVQDKVNSKKVKGVPVRGKKDW